ncbi:HAD-IIIA family hydrolase [Bacteroidales bacterium OttesenSCG-928-K03]|nr:HAD-IIIA family hydrolase [Odoribacter sp. OttesenSCG-928-L07]MDL2242689.1 HAD-IIIA family hydrolase [Bacteroidales bacterium OttesenSCG-928-K03]
MVNSAVILAGGFGTRLQSVIQNIPKPMAPVKGKAFLEYLLIYLLKNNIDDVVLSVGHLHESITSYFGNKYGKHVEIGNRIEYRELSISYAIENEPLGTGGGIKYALSKSKGENVFVLNGDSFFDINLKTLSDFYFEKQTNIAIALREVEDVSRYGSVEISEENKIISFLEKGQKTGEGLINAGIYILNRNILNDFPEKFSFEKDFLENAIFFQHKNNDKLIPKHSSSPNLKKSPLGDLGAKSPLGDLEAKSPSRDLSAPKIFGLSFNNNFIDIGIPEDYNRAAEILVPYSSALFLDRDGVINKRLIDNYVTKPEEFVFLDGVIDAIKIFSSKFERIFVVTNQQGIGKGIMTCEDFEKVNDYMLKEIVDNNGKIDRVYFCPNLSSENHNWRKPNIGMGLQAKEDFPKIDFERSIMIGDSETDIIFGKRLKMKTVFIGNNTSADICCDSLVEFASTL